MTTLVTFSPSQTANFQFSADLDGTTYNIVVTWNLFGQRYYINIYTQQGALVVCLPLIGSPDDYSVSMTTGYFTTTLIYRTSSNQFEVG